MLTHNSTLYGTKILGELVGDIIYFPLWWYTAGLIRMMVAVKNFLKNREKSLAFFVWMKNIFRPMFGQYDFQGRMISFFIRLFQIFIRGIAMLFWSLLSVCFFLFWVLLPPIIIYEIYFQLF